MKTVKVAIIGMGTVGGGTYDLLTANHDKILSSYGLDVQIKKVLDKDEQKLVNKVKPEQVCRSLDEILADEEISIVVEVMGGVEPAKTFITKIMQSGKSVVTANKELISKQWADLERVARENGVGLYFEASCVGGVPIIRTLNESLQGDNIKSIMGIINGTTNYILTKMTEEGMSYEEALAQAQQLGYAEFNPTADVDGYDAMYKLSILSSLAFHTCIPYTSIYREGITKVSQDDIAFGKKTGYKIKLLAIGKKKDNDVEVRVHPTLIAENHPLASVSGAFNAVFLNGDFVDDVMLYGRGAGAYPTGSAIVSDVIYCALKTSHVYTDFENDGKVSEDINIVSDFESKYYVTLIVDDKPGVIASISSVWGKNGVSIKFFNQSAFTQNDYVPIVIMTHTTNENMVQKTLGEIASLPCVREIRSVIRVID